MRRAALTVLAVAFVGSCHKHSDIPFPLIEEEFVDTMLSFSPVSATGQGYHSYHGTALDSTLDDVSQPAVEAQRSYLTSLDQRLKIVDKNRLPPEERADFDMIRGVIGLTLFDTDVVQTWRHNPTVYVETAGAALFNPYVLNYAPQPERARHIIARLEKMRVFFDQAAKVLLDSPAVWIDVARQENQGNIEFIEQTLPSFVPADQRAAFDQAALHAITSLRSFDEFLALSLPRKADWRLGPQNYAIKFRFALGTDRTPDEVLATSQTDLKRVRAEMLQISQKILKAAGKPESGTEEAVIRAALDWIAEKHSTRETFLADARGDLGEAQVFAERKQLLTLTRQSNLQVIETPVFMRGIYSVGGFNAAPALEPQLGAFYWVTPIPAQWEKNRAESKLREYNFYNLKLLTIHEAMPGHYVQSEAANGLQPRARRTLRAIWGNTPYVEGWAQYATQTMLDEGFLDNSPELRLTFLKQELRVIANAILDIRLHAKGMTDQQAMDLMEKDTFQEHEEATAKLQRAKLSSAQLPAYFVGWNDWRRVRAQYAREKGKAFQLKAFHDAALKEGAVPLPVLYRLLTGKELVP